MLNPDTIHFVSGFFCTFAKNRAIPLHKFRKLNNLIVKDMKRLILSLALLAGSMTAMHAQLLYKVSATAKSDSTSPERPSYIVASCPLINPMGTITQTAGVKEALYQTDQICFEVNKGAYASAIADAKKLDGGKKLLSLLTPTQQAKLNAFLKKHMEVDFRSSYVQKKYGDLTPVALLEDLGQLLFVANHLGEYDPTHTFDQYFEAQAKANNEPVISLSDADAYIATTYKSDLKQQTARLVAFLENENTELGKMDKAVDAYGAQDLDAVTNATSAYADKATLQAWAAKVATIMAEKPTLFVIDAANLGGEGGLLQQLRQAGMTVEGMK